MKAKKEVLEFEDKGVKLLRVQIGKKYGDYCEIEKEEYEALMELGLSSEWGKGPNNNVRAKCSASKSGFVLVARVMTNAGEFERVLFRDKNQRNLRRSNLGVLWDAREGLTNHRELVVSAQKMAENKDFEKSHPITL